MRVRGGQGARAGVGVRGLGESPRRARGGGCGLRPAGSDALSRVLTRPTARRPQPAGGPDTPARRAARPRGV